ncbi:MAG: hypothetical protein KDD53_13005, partial [Bdellovibrionales bacterium]|nr:hypothetical protein [Bdellovibrionales bacterium]
FFDNSAKAYSTVNFGIVDAYEINDGRDASGKDPAPSFFIWSEVLFDSFQDGYIKKLDLDFYLMLESAVSKRLYRYLDKHFWYKSSKKINVFVLAHEKLGISRNYRFLSSIRQQLDPAIEELTRLGFLSNAAYVGRGKDAEIILYAANGVPRSVSGGATSTNSGVPEVIGGVGGTSSGDRYPHYLQNNEETPSNYRPPQQEMELLSGEFDSVKAELAKKLVERGIRKNQVRNLIENRSLETLKRMVKIIAHYDYLIQSDSNVISRSPVCFLYRESENLEEF